MIREMQLLDALAMVVEDTTTGEQRMIISSKCGSKFVTVIGLYISLVSRLCYANQMQFRRLPRDHPRW
jgi:hypothetical protein